MIVFTHAKIIVFYSLLDRTLRDLRFSQRTPNRTGLSLSESPIHYANQQKLIYEDLLNDIFSKKNTDFGGIKKHVPRVKIFWPLYLGVHFRVSAL